jgi:hypothetical protein
MRAPGRLLLEAGDSLPFIDRNDTERRCVGDRYFDRGKGDGRTTFLMRPQHAGVVHLVHMVARQHDQVAGILRNDRVEILVHRVGGPLVPVFAHAFLRRKDFNELAELFGDDAPAHADVAVERQRLVLRRDVDASQARVDAVAQREVDDAVWPTKIDGRLRAVSSQRRQPFTRAARKHDDKAVVEQRGHDAQLLRRTTRAGAPSAPTTASGRQNIS